MTGLAPGLSTRARLLVRAGLSGFGHRFRREILAADAALGADGLAAAADVLLTRYSGPLTVLDAGRVPASGPLLVVANHPGTVDTPALWRVLDRRPDLRIIALDRPFLHAVPHLAQRLLYVADEGHQRSRLVRDALAHLRAGGALLSFPAGETEPDPAVRPADAVAALDTWSRSPELFARLVPGMPVLPVAVSGVLSTKALAHPLVRIQRDLLIRERAAATYQIVVADRSIRPVVRVGEPLVGRPHQVTEDLRTAMTALLTAPAP